MTVTTHLGPGRGELGDDPALTRERPGELVRCADRLEVHGLADADAAERDAARDALGHETRHVPDATDGDGFRARHSAVR